jgi:hypothetical protein
MVAQSSMERPMAGGVMLKLSTQWWSDALIERLMVV